MKTDKSDTANSNDSTQGNPLLYLALSDTVEFERVVLSLSKESFAQRRTVLGPER